MNTVQLQQLVQLAGNLEVQKKASTTKRLRLTAGQASSELHQSLAGEESPTSSSSWPTGTKISETVKEKLSLLRVGGMKKVFRRVFNVIDGERLLKASQCCLSTTSGPISGKLFISTEKISFCSDRFVLEFPSSSTGEKLRYQYKISIPLRKISRVNQSENLKCPSEKYLQVITTDGFEFWFIGFVNYRRMFKRLHQAISEA